MANPRTTPIPTPTTPSRISTFDIHQKIEHTYVNDSNILPSTNTPRGHLSSVSKEVRNFGQKSKFWTKIEILDKNRNFGQKSKF